jgi:hypothetical protein
MATAKITITIDPAEYATLKAELADHQVRLDTERKSEETGPRERSELGARMVRLEKLQREIL